MDDREILLGNLLVDACAALDARQLDAFDAIVVTRQVNCGEVAVD